MSRRDDLLRKAAAALEDGRDPLERSFLIEHTVTIDECFDLADDLALGARMLLKNNSDLRAGGLQRKVAAGRLVDAALHDVVSR